MASLLAKRVLYPLSPSPTFPVPILIPIFFTTLRNSNPSIQIALTGAGSGIGLATAKLLASRGAILSICDIEKSKLDTALSQLSGKGHFATKVDVSKAAQVNAWIEATVQKLGGLDGAANVAGIEREGGRHFADARDEDWEMVMGVNCSGVFYSMRAQIRQMLESGGSIVSLTAIRFRNISIDTDTHSSWVYAGQRRQHRRLDWCRRDNMLQRKQIRSDWTDQDSGARVWLSQY